MKPILFSSSAIVLLSILGHGIIKAYGRRFTVGQGVVTSSGLVLGHPASQKTQVSEYLGIPFAKPPIGSLRFTAPQAFEGSGEINASVFVRS